MDALSEILRTARLSGGVFLSGAFTEPWGLETSLEASDFSAFLGPADHLVLYHYVIEGTLVIELAGERPEEFHAGQAVIFPRNDRHKISGRQAAKAVSALDLAKIPKPGELMVIEHGGGGAGTRIICGFLGGRLLAGDPLFSSLPAVLRYDCASERSGGLVSASFDIAAREVSDSRPGADAMLARLSELLFVEAVRSYVEGLEGEASGLFGALQDRSLGTAIALMHRNPEQPWTVPDLARAVGASRSSLTEKFARHLGCAPMEFLVGHRMRLAARALEASGGSLMTIAESIGYGSEAAFSRAFKRAHGVSPSAWRAKHRVSPRDS